MKFEEIITNRYSVRKYTDQKVEPEKLEKNLKSCPRCADSCQQTACSPDCYPERGWL